LVTRPAIILADEPTGNLDTTSGNDILNIIEELHKMGNTIIVVTHDNNIASRANRILKIIDGKLQKDGSLA